MSIADEIKQSIHMDDIFYAYGLEKNRSGFISCPFHSEKTASLKAYADNTRFKCFGCGAGGDVIGFVMMMHNVTFLQACKSINDTFSLMVLEDHLKYSEVRKIKKERQEKERVRANIQAAKDTLREYNKTMRLLAPMSQGELLHPLFVEAMHNRDRICYFLNLIERR